MDLGRYASAKRTRSVWVFSLCLVWGLGIVGATDVARAAEEVIVDGVPHVKNGAEPEQGRVTWELEELWRAGGYDEDVFFGLITQVTNDEQGNIYLLDTQISEVRVFSPEGEELRTLSRQGEGPGEVNRPIDMLFMPDGTLGLAQAFPGKIVQIDLEGNPAGSFEPGSADPTQGGFFVFLDAKASASHVVIAGIRLGPTEDMQGQKRTRFLASYAPDGTEDVRYLESSNEFRPPDIRIAEKDEFFVYPRRWTLDAGGRVYAATARDEFEITVYEPDGSVARVIRRDFTSKKRTADETARIEAAFEAQRAQVEAQGLTMEIEIEDYEPVISQIRLHNDQLWVYHNGSYRDVPEGVMGIWDVFSKDGRYLQEVSIAVDADGFQDGLFFVGDKRLLVVKGLAEAALAMQNISVPGSDEEEPEPMEVICYRVAS